jgi:DNA-binding SARP family transcriptional activator
MYRLRLLGGFIIETPGGDSATPALRPGAEALVAVLAVTGVLGFRRARLDALFWPEVDDSRARHNLRDTIHSVRSSLGKDSLVSRGDSLHLNPSILSSDVQEFEEALVDGRLNEAAALYRGPLLAGFQSGGSRVFEQWIDEERDRLSREYLETVKRLAKNAENEGHWDAAAGWWAKTVAQDRYNSRYVVRRMAALARAGDQANALIEAEAHGKLLKSELGMEPTQAFLEEVERIRSGMVGPVSFFTPGPAAPSDSPGTEP